ncbi:uncharacterized protein LOC100194056 isoform 2 [Zea mays]|uniref:Uncharacterized protein n=1 Tax=Zea mays TaxID=4577 RepID=K7UAX8_MAIZE|nr:uncharacterized protein LOC100194056 isoform 2 [Zea mays]|eukprot:NP_001339265.1 uncharacterized protein LOC100194056 isoform 2 [Zea mays]
MVPSRAARGGFLPRPALSTDGRRPCSSSWPAWPACSPGRGRIYLPASPPVRSRFQLVALPWPPSELSQVGWGSPASSPRQPSLPPSSWTPNVDLIPTCSLVESSSSLVVDLPQLLGSNSADASPPWLRTSYGAGLRVRHVFSSSVRTSIMPVVYMVEARHHSGVLGSSDHCRRPRCCCRRRALCTTCSTKCPSQVDITHNLSSVSPGQCIV